jgi:hypothetical protein
LLPGLLLAFVTQARAADEAQAIIQGENGVGS